MQQNQGIILHYEIDGFEELNVKICEVNETWLDFISKNRTIGGLNHNYDIVIGPVADDTVFNVIDTYLYGDYAKNEAIKRLKLVRRKYAD